MDALDGFSPLPLPGMKARHPYCYWVRVLMLAFLVVTFTIAYLDASADTVTVGTGTEVHDDSGYVYHYYGATSRSTVRQMNGTLWMFVADENVASSDVDILGYWSPDNGTTWEGPTTVVDENHPEFEVGGFPLQVLDAVALSNNSIGVMTRTAGFVDPAYYEIQLFLHWNNSDLTQWERVQIYASGTASAYGGSMAVNASDVICLSWEVAGSKFYRAICHPANRTVNSKWENLNPQSIPFVLCNMSDEWIIAYDYVSGLDRIYFRDYDWNEIHSDTHNTGYDTYTVAICPVDDTLLWVSQTAAGGWLYFNYWNATGQGCRQINNAAQTDCPYVKIGVTNSTNVYVYGYDISEDEFYVWGRPYYQHYSLWRASASSVWEETGDYYDYVTGTPIQLYPQITDPLTSTTNLTQIPGGAFYFFFQESDGTDHYDYWEQHSTTWSWPGVYNWTYTNPEPEPEPEPEPTSDATDMWIWGDQCISTWAVYIILAFFIIFMIAVVGSAMR